MLVMVALRHVISILFSYAGDGSVTSATSILLSNEGEGSPVNKFDISF